MFFESHTNVFLIVVIICAFHAFHAQASNPPNPTLLEAVQATAGVFRNKTSTQDPDLAKTVLLVLANYGYLNHLQNFLCFTERLGMEPLIISVEAKVHRFISEKTTYTSHLFNTKLRFNDTIETGSASWRSQQFFLISNLKVLAALEVMKLGYHVFFTDPDVAILSDPTKYLFWKNVDYTHSMNVPCDLNQNYNYLYNPELEGNTGFYLVKSTKDTIKLFQESIRIAPEFGTLDDQSIFWILMRQYVDPPIYSIGPCQDVDANNHTVLFNTTATSYSSSSSSSSSPPKNIVICAMDACLFSSGMVNGGDRHGNMKWDTLRQNLLKRNDGSANKPISVHANWIIGNQRKQMFLKKAGLWLIRNDHLEQHFGKDNCVPYRELPIAPLRRHDVSVAAHHPPNFVNQINRVPHQRNGPNDVTKINPAAADHNVHRRPGGVPQSQQHPPQGVRSTGNIQSLAGRHSKDSANP